MKCVIQGWQRHQAELYHWLLSRLGNSDDADDVLQMVFTKAISQGEKFCAIENDRAWLFRVARNILVDRYRLKRDLVELPAGLAAVEDESEAIDKLTACLPRVLSELSAEDREAITLCDLDSISQQDYAQMKWDESGKVCCFVPRKS